MPPRENRLQTHVRPPFRPPHLRAPAAVAVVACLALAPAAFAHVSVTPPFVEAGVPTTVSFETPNEREGRATTSVELEAPADVELGAATPPPGWRVEVEGRRARWTGGRIEGAAVVAFPVVVTAQTPAGTQRFSAVQGYDDGEAVEWTSPLAVLPAPAAKAPEQRLDRALAAGVIGLVVVAGSLFALRRLRRRPLQEQ